MKAVTRRKRCVYGNSAYEQAIIDAEIESHRRTWDDEFEERGMARDVLESISRRYSARAICGINNSPLPREGMRAIHECIFRRCYVFLFISSHPPLVKASWEKFKDQSCEQAIIDAEIRTAKRTKAVWTCMWRRYCVYRYGYRSGYSHPPRVTASWEKFKNQSS